MQQSQKESGGSLARALQTQNQATSNLKARMKQLNQQNMQPSSVTIDADRYED